MRLDSAVFYTNDIEKVKEFYCDFLGLKLDYVTPERFVQFSFENEVKLGIKKATEAREKPGTGTIFIDAENVEELFESFREKGIKFHKDLKIEEWATNFAILDPDGNKLQFVRRSNE